MIFNNNVVTMFVFLFVVYVYRDVHGHIVPGCEEGVCENIILNIPAGLLRNITNFILIISTMISYALLLAPVREYIETIAMDVVCKPHALSSFSIHWMVNVLRIVMVFITAVVATKAPYFADVLSTVGGITDSYLAYILPALIMVMVLRRPSSASRSEDVTCPTFAVCLFCFILLWGIVLALSTLYGLMFEVYSASVPE
jgi:hypothetical protein